MHQSWSDECDIGFQMQSNMEFTSQVMDFCWIASLNKNKKKRKQRQIVCSLSRGWNHRCETISLSIVFNLQFHAKYLTLLTNQNVRFYSMMRFKPEKWQEERNVSAREYCDQPVTLVFSVGIIGNVWRTMEGAEFEILRMERSTE